MPEDGLVGGGAQVKHPVVQAGVLVHLGKVALLILSHSSPCVFNLERQLGVARRYNPHL